MSSRTHVVMLSGGVTSYLAAKRVVEQIDIDEPLVLLFADTKMEDEDLYRFLGDIAQRVAAVTVVAEGRTPWEVFTDVRFLGNSRVDPCSRILKRELLRRWLKEHCDPAATTVYLGYDWDEAHRIQAARRYWAPWNVTAPMAEPPYLSKAAMLDELKADGIAVPRLYQLGFEHNNCGGFCVKSGQAQFAHLLRTMPARYAEHEAREEMIRAQLGNVAIMTDRRGGTRRPLTMREFRERLEATGDYDQQDFGACSCFAPGVASRATEGT